MSKYRAPYAPEFWQQIVDPVRVGVRLEELVKEFGPSTPTWLGLKEVQVAVQKLQKLRAGGHADNCA